ncbi:MAG: hypothetical protein ACKVP0_11790 [Pirellulaceae bacterium]
MKPASFSILGSIATFSRKKSDHDYSVAIFCPRLTLTFGIAAAITLFASPALGKDFDRPRSTVLEFEILGDGDYLAIPVNIKGKEYAFVLDTGCSVSALDKSLISLTEGPSTFESVGMTKSDEILEFRSAPMMKAKGVILTPAEKITILDLSLLRKASAQECFGIIGMDCLKVFTLVIDLDGRRVYFCDPPRHRKLDTPTAPPIPLKYNENQLPQIEVEVGKKHYLFTLDSGDSGSGYIGIDSEPEMRNLLYQFSSIGIESDAKGTTTQSENVRCRLLKAGNVTVSDALFGFGKSNQLGLLFFRRYRTTLRFDTDEAFFEGTKYALDYDHSDWHGIELGSSSEGRLVVVDVLAKSLGSKSGIMKGDEIVSLGKFKVRPYRYPDVILALKVGRHEDQVLTVMRGGSQKQLILPGEALTRRMLD